MTEVPVTGTEIAHTTMYLGYGAPQHLNQVVVSLLTAFRHLPPDAPGHRYVVYTDHPEAFTELGVSVRTVNAAELEQWLGGLDYIHRRKTVAIVDALRRFGGKLLYVDGDTYFRASPAKLFDRIGPGRTCMHVLEAGLLQSRTPQDKVLSDLLMSEPLFDTTGQRLIFSADEPMWNAGVIGIDAADINKMHEAVCLTDQLWRKIRTHTVEQFATCYALAGTKIAGCRDVVFHYWPEYLREPFQIRLGPAATRQHGESLRQWADRAYAACPKPTPSRWLRVRVKEGLRRAGFNVGGYLRSA